LEGTYGDAYTQSLKSLPTITEASTSTTQTSDSQRWYTFNWYRDCWFSRWAAGTQIAGSVDVQQVHRPVKLTFWSLLVTWCTNSI